MFDLCEDDDVLVSVTYSISFAYIFNLFSQIRKQAIKDLVRKIAYALAQILQSEDNSEVIAVHNSIASLYQIDPAGKMKFCLLLFLYFALNVSLLFSYN
jgi:hypothetical protein